jgi:hypothetical protein
VLYKANVDFCSTVFVRRSAVRSDRWWTRLRRGFAPSRICRGLDRTTMSERVCLHVVHIINLGWQRYCLGGTLGWQRCCLGGTLGWRRYCSVRSHQRGRLWCGRRSRRGGSCRKRDCKGHFIRSMAFARPVICSHGEKIGPSFRQIGDRCLGCLSNIEMLRIDSAGRPIVETVADDIGTGGGIPLQGDGLSGLAGREQGHEDSQAKPSFGQITHCA